MNSSVRHLQICSSLSFDVALCKPDFPEQTSNAHAEVTSSLSGSVPSDQA
jgi:hypothetical protein